MAQAQAGLRPDAGQRREYRERLERLGLRCANCGGWSVVRVSGDGVSVCALCTSAKD